MKKLLLLGAITISINSFGQVPNYVPSNNLVAWYGFNGNANDETGNGNNGIITGAIATQDRFGNSNSAYSFNGSSDYIAVDYSFDFEERTFSCWFNPNSLAGTFNGAGHILTMDDDGLTYGMMTLKIEDSVLTLRSGGEPSPFTDSITQTGIWYNLIVTRNSTETKYYLNGSLIGSGLSGSSGSTVNPNPYLVIGSGRVYNPQNFDGLIDDIGIWNRALTVCEIQDLYNAGLNSVVNTVTQTGPQLDADQSGATYQWLDCDNGNQPINGEANQSYTPLVTGNYSVEINLNNCIVNSTCYLVDYTNINELYNSLITIYPNPSSDNFKIIGIEKLKNVKTFEITSITGARVAKRDVYSSEIDISSLDKGIYLFVISHENGTEKIRFIKD